MHEVLCIYMRRQINRLICLLFLSASERSIYIFLPQRSASCIFSLNIVLS